MDERLAQIEKEKQQALQDSNSKYESLLQDNQNLYNQQNAYAEQYEQTQNEALDKQLVFQEQKIEQQKEIARQNKETEEKKAKNDYFSYINPYGVQAESFASNGLLNSGVSETAKLGGYNTYQNRLASANKAMQDAFVQYDNDMNEARLNNDVQKAQNALARLQMQLQYSENFYNQKSNLTQNQLSNNQGLESEYYNRYNVEYNNIQQEKAREEAARQWEAEMAEKQRQFNAQMEYQKQQDALAQQNWEKEYALSKQKANSSYGGNSGLTDGASQSLSDNNSSSSSDYDAFGNSAETMKKSDYYFKSTNGTDYQPRYINNIKLSKTGKTLKDIGKINGVSGNKNVWKAGNNYYVWDEDHYIDVTKYYSNGGFR